MYQSKLYDTNIIYLGRDMVREEKIKTLSKFQTGKLHNHELLWIKLPHNPSTSKIWWSEYNVFLYSYCSISFNPAVTRHRYLCFAKNWTLSQVTELTDQYCAISTIGSVTCHRQLWIEHPKDFITCHGQPWTTCLGWFGPFGHGNELIWGLYSLCHTKFSLPFEPMV
jgi:hypothetical protein